MRGEPRSPLASHLKVWIAVALAWAAGFVDAAVWSVFYHVYTSHMTGNTASFANAIVERKWGQALLHGWVFVPFMAGLLYSAATTKAARRHGFHSSFSIALLTELLLLSAFVELGSRYLDNGHPKMPIGVIGFALLSMPAAAMGLQTVTVTRINGLRVYTTYLTGSLSKFSESVIDYLFWVRDRTRGRLRSRFYKVLRLTPRQNSVQHAALTAGLWVGFFLGALSGIVAEQRFALVALYAPMAVLGVAIAVDLIRPVAAADEPEQSNRRIR
jgi:uncharacterized membrane protein YoaK (UPF0700 family)